MRNRLVVRVRSRPFGRWKWSIRLLVKAILKLSRLIYQKKKLKLLQWPCSYTSARLAFAIDISHVDMLVVATVIGMAFHRDLVDAFGTGFSRALALSALPL